MSAIANDHCVTTKKSTKSVKKKIPDGYKLVPPDGNYAWVVLFGCCMGGICIHAPIHVFSVFLYDLISLHATNAATLSWIPSIIMTTAQLTGPVNTVIVNTLGVRKTTIMGGLLTSLGMTTSYFTNRIDLLCITYGFIVGFGLGLLQLCFPIVLSQYFRKYFGVASGILIASYAVGRFVSTSLAQYLREVYEYHAIFLIIGAHTLHICVGAMLFQPVRRHMVLVPIDPDSKKLLDVNEENVADKSDNVEDVVEHETDNTKKENCTKEVQEIASIPMLVNDDNIETEQNRNNLVTMITTCSNDFGSVSSIAIQNEKENSNKQKIVKASNCFCLLWCRKNICSKIDFTLFREPCFYVVCGNGVIAVSVTAYSNFFLFPLGVEKGCSAAQLASIITIKALVDIVMRVAGPLLITYFNLPVRKTYVTLAFLNGIIFAAIVFVNSYHQIVVWTITSGVSYGSTNALSRVLLVKTMGTKRLASVIGLSQFVQGFFLLPMAPILGWIRDTTGSFANIYLVFSFMQFTLMILWIIKPYLPQKKTVK